MPSSNEFRMTAATIEQDYVLVRFTAPCATDAQEDVHFIRVISLAVDAEPVTAWNTACYLDAGSAYEHAMEYINTGG
jgi:hypothetical protein